MSATDRVTNEIRKGFAKEDDYRVKQLAKDKYFDGTETIEMIVVDNLTGQQFLIEVTGPPQSND